VKTETVSPKIENLVRFMIPSEIHCAF